MPRLHFAVALPLVLAGIIGVSGAQAASLRVGDATLIVHEVAGRQFNDQTWGSKAEGDDVYENEFIRTAVESQARFLLVDRTALAVGPITTIRIDRVVFNPDQSIKGVVVSAGQGTLRWTSGDSSAYLIRTPTANVTPTGTVFDLFVDSQRTFVILREGRVKVCTTSLQEKCRTLAEPGEMILATVDELQGPARGGPSPSDFANRCLSATGQDCVMNLTYTPPPAQQRRPPVSSEPRRADIQPPRGSTGDERPSRQVVVEPRPRVVVVEPPRPRVMLPGYVVPRPRVIYPSYYRPSPGCVRCAYANYGSGSVRYPPMRPIYPLRRGGTYGGYGGGTVNAGAGINPGSVLH